MEEWFSKGLTSWYCLNKRDLPWRDQKDPYKIWLSEIILQQTQVAQGLSYYLSFVSKYPTVKHLAMAPEDEVLRLWQGLGYYSRARNLHATARHIQKGLKGVFPSSYNEIKVLKGVGDYTAAAIASFAFDLPYAVVDGNVYRVLSRIFGIDTAIDTSQAKKEFQNLASQLLNKKSPANHNQAIMEFGSQFCKPSNPNCEACVFKNKCLAFKTSRVHELPFKSKKTKIRDRFFNYLVIADRKGDVLLTKRENADIWKGLYEFNLVETEKKISEEALLRSASVTDLCKGKFTVRLVSKDYKHILTHQHLYARFYVLRLSSSFKPLQLKSSIGRLNTYAFPRLIGKFLDDCDLKEIV